MGFLPSNGVLCFNDFDIFWTDIGRDYLIGKNPNKQGLIIYSFSLGDNDTNYMNSFPPELNFIPDATGNHRGCLLGTKINQIRYEIKLESVNATGTQTIFHNNKELPDCSS